ncbi:MAG: DUF1573 domain-containing protein [Flavobacteriales bacterium]|jgi:hypothetical protein|nr:DUF1573 domain-containing protein [Flavobacteriales bacterium]
MKILLTALLIGSFALAQTQPKVSKIVKKPTAEQQALQNKTENATLTQVETPVAKKPAPTVQWKEEVFDFGDIKQGVPVTHDFSFVNNTKEIVIISNVKASCGCTATNYTKTPIKPGETGTITAKYNAAAGGPFTKTVTVEFGDDKLPKILTIKGKVVTEAQ